jgi:hypothetical protein
MTREEFIKEATLRGIVSGAELEPATNQAGGYHDENFIVPEDPFNIEKIMYDERGYAYLPAHGAIHGRCWYYYHQIWAKVISSPIIDIRSISNEDIDQIENLMK